MNEALIRGSWRNRAREIPLSCQILKFPTAFACHDSPVLYFFFFFTVTGREILSRKSWVGDSVVLSVSILIAGSNDRSRIADAEKARLVPTAWAGYRRTRRTSDWKRARRPPSSCLRSMIGHLACCMWVRVCVSLSPFSFFLPKEKSVCLRVCVLI